jgi:hypothetical protein
LPFALRSSGDYPILFVFQERAQNSSALVVRLNRLDSLQESAAQARVAGVHI